MAKVLKKGVTVDQSGVISVDPSVKGIDAATAAGVAQNNVDKTKALEEKAASWINMDWKKPVVSPTLQAKIDAKKTAPTNQPIGSTAAGTAASTVGAPATTPAEGVANAAQVTVPPVTPEPTNQPAGAVAATTAGAQVDQPKPAETAAPVVPPSTDTPKNTTTTDGQKIEPSDVEKTAQASGVAYTMDGATGQPVYNPSTKDEALKVLQMGGKLQGESKLNAVAQNTLNKVRNLSQMTDKQLSQNIVNGSVSPKELEMLNQVNPDLVKRAQDFATKTKITDTTNSIQSDNAAIIEGKEGTIQNTALNTLLQKVQKLDADKETYGEIKKRVYEQYPEMEQARTDIVDAQQQLRELQRAKRALYDDYKKQNSSLPISMIQAGFSGLSRALDDQIYVVNDSLSQNVAIYNSYLDDAQAEIKWEVDQQGAQEERLWKMYGVTRAEEVRAEDIQREDDRIQKSIDLEEQRYQRDVERQDTVSARERQYKIEDLKNQQNSNIETGLLSLGVDPTGMTPEEMKAEYAQATKSQMASESNLKARDQALKEAEFYKGNWTIEKIKGKDMRVNKDTGEILPVTQPVSSKYGFSTVGNATQVNVEGTEDIPKGRRQCGAYVNDSLYGGSGGGVMKDSIESKLATINSDKPVPMSAFVMDFGDAEQPGKGGIRNGHTGIVEEVRQDGIVISDMNRQGDEQFRRTFIPYNSKEYGYIKGFTVPPQVAEGEGASQYTNIEEVVLPEKSSEYTKKSFGFGVRMDQAEKSIKTMEEKFKESTTGTEFIGGKLPNWLKTSDRQAFEQAGRNFINAVLRQESGAVISDDEFANAYKQYIPQPGDSKEVLEQKAQSRKTAVKTMFGSAGKTEDGENIKDIYDSLDLTNQY